MYLINSVNDMMLCSGKGTMATVTRALRAKLQSIQVFCTVVRGEQVFRTVQLNHRGMH